MASFNIECPHCGGELEVLDEWADMETNCPLCGNAFMIPRREVPFPVQAAADPVYDAGAADDSGTAGSGEETYETDQTENSPGKAFASLCYALGGICLTVGVILLGFGKAPVGVGLCAAAIVLFIVGHIVTPRSKFELNEGEKILLCLRLCDDDKLYYYTRITNQRVVLSAIEYFLLPEIVAFIYEATARPTKITYSWNIEDMDVEVRKDGFFSSRKMYVTAAGDSVVFAYDAAFMKWWDSL